MERINFEDGQLVTAGYVQIEDVKYPITEAEYDGATPLSAFILNKMQENIEKAIGDVSSFDPVIVEELPTENIQEKTMYLVLSNADEEIKKYDAYIYKDNEWKQIGSAELDSSKLTVNLVENSYDLTLTEAVEGGGTITLPSMYKVGFDRLDVYLNGEKLIKAETSDTEGHYYEVGTQGTLSNVIRITSDWTAEVGDVFEFTIRTNGEGKTEENLDIYSTEEQVIGKWIDGKLLYRKVIDVNVNNLSTSNDVSFDCTNIEQVIEIKGIMKRFESWEKLPKGTSNSDYLIDIYVYTNENKILIAAGNSVINGISKIYLIIEYTKTTDIGEV